MSEFSIIDMFLKLNHTVHSARSLCKLVLVERQAYSEPCQRPKIECFVKLIIVFNYFCKKLHIKSLKE